MHLRAFVLPVALLLAASPASTPDADRVPRQAFITGACNPSGNAAVNPQRIDMTRVDNIEWHSQSPRVASFTITPKVPENWPFAAQSFAGTRDTPAVTPQPLPSALLNHTYSYNVNIVCEDGTTQLIDPDIIIGSGT